MKYLLPAISVLAVVLVAVALFVTIEGKPPPAPEVDGITDNREAQAMLSRLLADTRRFPDNSLARRRLCLALEANGFDATAVDCYRGLIPFYDDDERDLLARTHVRLASTLARVGNNDKAIEALDRAGALAPGHAPIHWRAGRLLAEKGAVERAEAAYRQAMATDPQDPGGHWGLARLLIQRGEFGAAITHLEHANDETGNRRYTQYLLGRALRGAGRQADAERAFARAGDAEPVTYDPWEEEVRGFSLAVGTRIDHALDLSDAGRHDEARALLEAMLTGSASEVAVLNALGRVEVSAGFADAATGYFLRALRLQPDAMETRLNLAAARLTSGNHLEAARHAGTVLEQEPDNLRALEINGHALMQLDRFDGAIAAFGAAIDEGSPDAMLRIWNALMLCRQDRCDAATPLIDDAVKLFPGNIDVQARAVSLALAAGRPDVARRALANLEALAPDHPRLSALKDAVNAG